MNKEFTVAFVEAAREGGAVGAGKEIDDHADVSCEVGSLVGIIQRSNLDAVIPNCAQYQYIERVITKTFTSTSTHTRARIETATVTSTLGEGCKVKALEGTRVMTASMPGLGRREDYLRNQAGALAERMNNCPSSHVYVACTVGAKKVREVTTTTTVMKKATVYSTTTTTTSTSIETPTPSSDFRIFLHNVDRKSSTDSPGRKYYLTQAESDPCLVYLTPNGTKAIEFQLKTTLFGYVDDLKFLSKEAQGAPSNYLYSTIYTVSGSYITWLQPGSFDTEWYHPMVWQLDNVAKTITLVEPPRRSPYICRYEADEDQRETLFVFGSGVDVDGCEEAPVLNIKDVEGLF